MAWASEVAATQLTSITTEQFFVFSGSSNVTLNPKETCVVEVDVNFPASPTDEAIVSVYGSLDAGTDYDDTPWLTFRVANVPDPNQVTFAVIGLYSFRVGVKRSGTTDTLTSADARHRKDGVNA